MCLAIPGQIVDVVDDANRLARVDVAGSVPHVRRHSTSPPGVPATSGLRRRRSTSHASGTWVAVKIRTVRGSPPSTERVSSY